MAWYLSPLVEVADCNGEYWIAAEVLRLAALDVDITLLDSILPILVEKSKEKHEEKLIVY